MFDPIGAIVLAPALLSFVVVAAVGLFGGRTIPGTAGMSSAKPAAAGLTTPQGTQDPKTAGGAAGASSAASSINMGAQGVPATRTAAGAEGSFTTTTVTLPKSGRPTTVQVSVSVGSCLVQVASIGGYFVAGTVQAANPPLVLDVSFLPESTSVAVQTQASVAQVIGIVANFA